MKKKTPVTPVLIVRRRVELPDINEPPQPVTSPLDTSELDFAHFLFAIPDVPFPASRVVDRSVSIHVHPGGYADVIAMFTIYPDDVWDEFERSEAAALIEALELGIALEEE